MNLISDCIESVFALAGTLTAHLVLLRAHHLVKIFISHLIALLLNLVLQVVDLVHALLLLVMLRLHLEVLEGLMELLVFGTLLLLFEGLNLGLLLQETALNLNHVLVSLEHLSEEIVGSGDRHARLNKELHALHDVGTGGVVTIRKKS